MAEPWLVGHGSAPLVVPPGTPLGGYAARVGVSTGTLDPLEPGAVAFVDTDGRTAVLCVVDVLQIADDLAVTCRDEVARACSTDPSLVWVAATHTHAGPMPGLMDGPVLAAVVEAALRARHEVVPARLTHHRGELAGVGGQRSGATRRTTVPVDVLRASGPDDRALGVLGVVPVHPTVLPATNLGVSGDLAAAARSALSARLDGAWSLVATSAAGDVSTRPHRRAQSPDELARLGGLVGDRLAATTGSPARAQATGPLSGAVGSVPLEAADPRASFRLGAAEAARAALAEATATGDRSAARDAAVALQGAELGPGEAGEGPVPCAVAALDLGGIRLLGLGGEPFLALGDRVPEAMLVGYANGYCGYLPTDEAFARACERPDYEVLISRVAPGQAERALAAAAGLSG
jgi:neutral ceramidase